MAKEKKIVKATPEVKTIDQLKADLVTKTTELLDARRGLAAGELANPRVIKATRKEIARIKTAIRQAELQANKENQ